MILIYKLIYQQPTCALFLSFFIKNPYKSLSYKELRKLIFIFIRNLHEFRVLHLSVHNFHQNFKLKLATTSGYCLDLRTLER